MDDPQTRAEAVAFLRARGLDANVRDWAMGKTIAVGAGRVDADDVVVWERVLWIVEDDEPRAWTLVTIDGLFEHVLGRFSNLRLACERAIVALGPGWGAERVDALLEIESVFEARGRVYVITKLVDSTRDFVVVESSKLDGCPVERWLDVPRAHDANGGPRLDVFAFCLRESSDRRHFRVGSRAMLTSTVTIDEL